MTVALRVSSHTNLKEWVFTRLLLLDDVFSNRAEIYITIVEPAFKEARVTDCQ
jgi:hypothetical protein